MKDIRAGMKVGVHTIVPNTRHVGIQIKDLYGFTHPLWALYTSMITIQVTYLSTFRIYVIESEFLELCSKLGDDVWDERISNEIRKVKKWK